MAEQDLLVANNASSEARQKRIKKEKKKRKREEAEALNDTTAEEAPNETATKTKEALKKRRLEREKLLEQVPKVDENGICYTKQQIRHMRKRVQRGLHPVETPAEKHARLVQESQLRKEEQAELAGLMDDDVEEHLEDNDAEREKHVVETNEVDLSDGESSFSYEKRPNEAGQTLADTSVGAPRPIKKKREKPVPVDYVCSACNNADGQSPHWIYDCIFKKTMPGTNQISRKKRGLQDPLETKLFVSGLPFDTTIKDVADMFSSKADAAVVHCKLIKFDDTKRCKGQAFVTFSTPETAKKALQLNGTVVPFVATQSKSGSQPKSNKELKLKITKVLNRVLTKMKKSNEGSTKL
jgi:RNA recognition motif. (a.k.a. RRM, RBD, or RNP domain)